jgi:hypothetical protein
MLRMDRHRAAVDGVGHGILVAALGQGCRLIEEFAGARHHLLATSLVVSAAAGRAVVLRDRVGAVERVVKAAPAGIGDRHHELRSGHMGDLLVHIPGRDREVLGLGLEIFDVAQEALVIRLVMGLAGTGTMVVVDLALQRIPDLQQLAVAGRELPHEGG